MNSPSVQTAINQKLWSAAIVGNESRMTIMQEAMILSCATTAMNTYYTSCEIAVG